MSQVGFPIQKLLQLILVIGVIVLIVVGFYYIFGPQVKTALGWNITDEDLNATKGGAIELYNSFMNDYKSCKDSADQGCLCNIDTFALPTGYRIELENSGTDTKVKLYAENDLVNKEDDEKGNNTIKRDALYFPKKTPGTIGVYLTDQAEFDLSNYVRSIKIKLYYDSPDSSETAIKMDGFIGSDPLSLYGLYKSNLENTYFVPTPYQWVGTGSEECLMKSLSSNIRKCNRLSAEEKASIDSQIKILKEQIEACKSIHLKEKDRPCITKIELKFEGDDFVKISGQTVTIKKEESESFISSYPIEVESKTTSTDIQYLYSNGHWLWKSNGGGCSCRFYPVNLRDPSIECSFDGVFSKLSPWYRNINSKLVEAETYEDSYTTGLAVLINSIFDRPGLISSPDLMVVKDTEVTFEQGDFEMDMEKNIEKLKKETTRQDAQDISMYNSDLGVKMCKLSSLDPIQRSSEEMILSGNVWIELVSMADGSVCYYQYSPEQIQELALKGALKKIGTN